MGAERPRRRGRPRKSSAPGTRDRILQAAESEFIKNGYDAVSLRAVARAAGVDPALVHHYFDDKASLFAESLRLPANPGDILTAALDGPVENMGERAMRAVLTVWDDPAVHTRGIVLVRTAGSDTAVGEMLRGFITREITHRVALAVPGPDAELRAGLVASQIVGVLFARYGIRLASVATLSVDQIVGTVGPTLQRYLTGDVPGSAGDVVPDAGSGTDAESAP